MADVNEHIAIKKKGIQYREAYTDQETVMTTNNMVTPAVKLNKTH